MWLIRWSDRLVLKGERLPGVTVCDDVRRGKLCSLSVSE